MPLTTFGWSFATKQVNISFPPGLYTMKVRKLFSQFVVAFILLFSLVSAGFAQRSGDSPYQEKLLNGLRVHMWPKPGESKVTLRLRIHSGSAFDQQGKEGTTRMLAESIFPTDSGREFFTEDLEGSFTVVNTYDYTELQISARPDGFLTMLETVASAISAPTIDAVTTDAARKRVLAELTEKLSDPAYIADRAAAKRLLGNFPYGRPILGTPETVAVIDFADLRFIYDRMFGADNATLSISGPIDRTQAFRAARRYFGSWLKSDVKIPSTFTQPEQPPTAMMIVDSPKPGSGEIRYATRGTARNDKDLAAVAIVARVVENRLRSKVSAERRDLVSVRHNAHYLPGIMMFGLSEIVTKIKTEDGPEVKVEASDILFQSLNSKIADTEFASARSAVSAERAKIPRETQWLDVETFKLTSVRADQASFAAVTLLDVQRVADRVRSSPMVSVMVYSPQETSPAKVDQ